MNDLNSKLTTLQAQLAEARSELEAAKTKAAQTDDLHEKLNYLTRTRAAQDLVSSLEQEISTVQNAIAEEQRREHRQELLERARGIAAEIQQHRDGLRDLLDAVAEAVAQLQRQAPGIIHRWRQSRERWLATFAALEPGPWPHLGGDAENSKRLDALQRALAELGPDGRALLQLPPGLQPTNAFERPSFEGKNWDYSPPSSPEDVSLYVLDTLLSRPGAQQPAAVPAPDPARSI
ncbi:hypothetical protein Mterra_02115 [Calidithermus terrae]|uniref:Chromosome partition protein Smc n=1 Tax=Calidithermus terrae TaxID=1408545 RepID=A0A399EJ83_9DEIN|nr:hypothetical protein [Calidithermus terrae]RIH84008.1 hypothetical protein Mterra_02115 [Calidithermus terrae]